MLLWLLILSLHFHLSGLLMTLTASLNHSQGCYLHQPSLSFLVKPFIHISVQTGAATLRKLNQELRRHIKYGEYMQGKPSEPSNVFRLKYKDAKRIFRKALRKYKHNELDAFYTSLDLDPAKCFHGIRARRGKAQATGNVIVNGQTFTGKQLVEGWATHFEKLASPNLDDFCKSTFLETETQVLDLFQQCMLEKSNISYPLS